MTYGFLLLLRCPVDTVLCIINALFLRNVFQSMEAGEETGLWITCAMFGVANLCLFLYNGTVWGKFAEFSAVFVAKLKQFLFESLWKLPLERIEEKTSGAWLTRLNSDVSMTLNLLTGALNLPHLVFATVRVAVTSILLGSISPLLLGLVDGTAPIAECRILGESVLGKLQPVQCFLCAPSLLKGGNQEQPVLQVGILHRKCLQVIIQFGSILAQLDEQVYMLPPSGAEDSGIFLLAALNLTVQGQGLLHTAVHHGLLQLGIAPQILAGQTALILNLAESLIGQGEILRCVGGIEYGSQPLGRIIKAAGTAGKQIIDGHTVSLGNLGKLLSPGLQMPSLPTAQNIGLHLQSLSGLLPTEIASVPKIQ
jgi:hypothetical protein